MHAQLSKGSKIRFQKQKHDKVIHCQNTNSTYEWPERSKIKDWPGATPQFPCPSLDLIHLKFENRSKTSRPRFLESFALTDKAVHLQLYWWNVMWKNMSRKENWTKSLVTSTESHSMNKIGCKTCQKQNWAPSNFGASPFGRWVPAHSLADFDFHDHRPAFTMKKHTLW